MRYQSPAACSHPLAGCDLQTLQALLRRAGPLPASSRRKLRGLTALAALRRMPARYEAARWPLGASSAPEAAPILIVGHWRSGTTHLGNVLAAGGRFGYVDPIAAGLPNELLSIGRPFGGLLARSVPQDRLIDRVPVTRSSPQEDEFALANMQGISFLHALYFPHHFDALVDRGLFLDGCSAAEIAAWERAWLGYLDKLRRYHHRQRLLLRNPMFSARLAQLRRLVPELRVVHVHRHPLQILRSMRHYYRRLLPALAWQPFDHVDIDATILRVYRRLMQRLIEDSDALPRDRYLEITYDDLSVDPLTAAERVYRHFAVPGWRSDRDRIASYLASIGDYRRNRFTPDPADVELVREPWAQFFERWEYAVDDHGAGSAAR